MHNTASSQKLTLDFASEKSGTKKMQSGKKHTRRYSVIKIIALENPYNV